jgi:hypothetical protein
MSAMYSLGMPVACCACVRHFLKRDKTKGREGRCGRTDGRKGVRVVDIRDLTETYTFTCQQNRRHLFATFDIRNRDNILWKRNGANQKDEIDVDHRSLTSAFSSAGI